MVDKIQQAYDLRLNQSADALEKFYDDWYSTGDYDQIMHNASYKAHTEIGVKLPELVAQKDARILDVGAGTGLAGTELFKAGFTNLYAVDGSYESLEICRKSGHYQHFTQCIVGPQRLPFEDNYFDATVSSGSFLPGHCDGTTFEEVLRVVKKGGVILIAMLKDFFYEPEFNMKKVTDAKCDEKACSLVHVKEVASYCKGKSGVVVHFKKL